jgi:hypothetical protein
MFFQSRAIAEAAARFREGRFGEAWERLIAIAADEPDNVTAMVRLAEVALLRNELSTAERWASQAIDCKPGNRQAVRVLADTLYRRDDFPRAAPLYAKLGETALARKLASFDAPPYAIEGSSDIARIPFLQTDPLPLVRLRVNGSDEAHFLIDTGGSELYLDSGFALQVGAARFGSFTGTFGGGGRAATEQGRVDRVALGDFAVRNVPVHILPLDSFSAVTEGKRVDGILGTQMLSHFTATLDYPRAELILRRRPAARPPNDMHTVPFWMAGDHYMVTWAAVNGAAQRLFFIDSGVGGCGFVPSKATLKEAAIRLPGGFLRGIGGGGAMRVVPFCVDRLAVGTAEVREVGGFFGVFPPALESTFGFRIAGMIAHDFLRRWAVTFDFDRMEMRLQAG